MNAIIRTRRQSLALLGAALAVPRAAMAAAVATPALDRSLPEAEFTPDGASTDLAGMAARCSSEVGCSSGTSL